MRGLGSLASREVSAGQAEDQIRVHGIARRVESDRLQAALRVDITIAAVVREPETAPDEPAAEPVVEGTGADTEKDDPLAAEPGEHGQLEHVVGPAERPARAIRDDSGWNHKRVAARHQSQHLVPVGELPWHAAEHDAHEPCHYAQPDAKDGGVLESCRTVAAPLLGAALFRIRSDQDQPESRDIEGAASMQWRARTSAGRTDAEQPRTRQPHQCVLDGGLQRDLVAEIARAEIP